MALTSKDALETLARLEERLGRVEREAKEGGGLAAAAVDGEGLLEYQKQVLVRLVTIRDALTADPAGDMAYVLKERDALREENAKLKKEAEKLNYRIAHLVKNVP